VQYKLITDKLVTLRDLSNALQVVIADAQSAADLDRLWTVLLLGTKLVGATCDVAVSVIADKMGVYGRGASLGYDVAKMIVDALNGDVTLKKALIFSGSAKFDAITDVIANAGNKPAVEVMQRLKLVAATANDLYEFWETNHEGFDGSAGILSAKRTAQGVLSKVQSQIADLEYSISSCPPPEVSATRGPARSR
jgi:hypothetical protein